MSLIHEALKRAARDEMPKVAKDAPRKIHISTGTIPLTRLVIIIGSVLILLPLLAVVYLRGSPSTKEVPSRPDTAAPAGDASSAGPTVPQAVMQNQETMSAEKQAFQHLQQGMSFFKEGKPAKAEEEYRRALSWDHNNIVIRNNLGLALKVQGKRKEAEEEYQAVLKLDPDYAPALNNLGLLYDDQNRIDEAIRLYQKALRNAPNYAAAHLNYASALERSGYQNEARQHYQAFLAHASREDQQAVSLVEKHLNTTP